MAIADQFAWRRRAPQLPLTEQLAGDSYKPEPKPLRTFTGPSVIEQFNAVHSVPELLEAHSYQSRGRRWAKPGTQHGAGLILFDDGRAFSLQAGRTTPLRSSRACTTAAT